MGNLTFPNLDNAIGKAEGFGVFGAIPTLANNPGDIVSGPFATSYGASGSITAKGGQQIATFPTLGQGQAAEDALVGKYSGGTLSDLAAGWLAGSSAVEQGQWLSNVTGALGGGVTGSTPVASLGTAAASAPAAAGGGLGGGGLAALLTGGISQWGPSRIIAILLGLGLIIVGALALAISGAVSIAESPVVRRAGKAAALVS